MQTQATELPHKQFPELSVLLVQTLGELLLQFQQKTKKGILLTFLILYVEVGMGFKTTEGKRHEDSETDRNKGCNRLLPRL